VWLKLLDLLILVFPVVIEWFKKRREKDESPKEYVKRVQAEKLKVYEELLKDDGQNITRMAKARILVVRALLARVRSEVFKPSAGISNLSDERTELPPKH
jgi:hypothetical protein